MESGSLEQIGQSGSRRTFSSVNEAARASYRSSRPISGSPSPRISFTTSVAWSRPIVPGSTPSTPLAPQEGASSAGGGTRKQEPGEGPANRVETPHRAPDPQGAPPTNRGAPPPPGAA